MHRITSVRLLGNLREIVRALDTGTKISESTQSRRTQCPLWQVKVFLKFSLTSTDFSSCHLDIFYGSQLKAIVHFAGTKFAICCRFLLFLFSRQLTV